MREFLRNLTSRIENPVLLYDGKWLKVEPIENPNVKPRPKSQAMQVTHPELYDFLMKKPGARKFVVGLMHRDGDGALSKQLRKEGKTELEIFHTLVEQTRLAFVDIARKIKADPSSALAKLEYLTSYSRLYSAQKVWQEMGFEIFDMDEGEDAKFNSASHRHIEKRDKNASEQFKANNRKKEAKIGLISIAKILELYGQESLGI